MTKQRAIYETARWQQSIYRFLLLKIAPSGAYSLNGFKGIIYKNHTEKHKKERYGDVTPWEVFGVIVTLVGFAIAIGTPIIKLNTSMTKLIEGLGNLREWLDELTEKNSKSHERIWKHNDEQDEKIGNHETRITLLEEKER